MWHTLEQLRKYRMTKSEMFAALHQVILQQSSKNIKTHGQMQGRGRARGRARSRKKLDCNGDIVDQMTTFVHDEAGCQKSEASSLPFIDDGRFDDLVEYSGQNSKIYHAQAVNNNNSPTQMIVAECSMETLDRHILEESIKATSCPAASIDDAGYKTGPSLVNHTFQEDHTDASYEGKSSGLPPRTRVPGSSLEIPFSHMAISEPDWMQLDNHSSGSDLCSLCETVTFTASSLKREETGGSSKPSKKLRELGRAIATNSVHGRIYTPRDDEDWNSSRHTFLQRGSVGRQKHACTGHMSHECSIQLHDCSGFRDQKGNLFSSHGTLPHATASPISQQLCSAHGCSCASKSRPQFDCDHTMYSKPCPEKGPCLERVDLHGGSFISPEHQKPRSFSSSADSRKQTCAKTLLIIPAHAIHSIDSAHQLLHFVWECMHRREDMQELAFEVLIRMKDEASPGNLVCMQSSKDEQYSPAVHSDPVGMMPGLFGKDFHSRFTNGDSRLMNPMISCRSSPHSWHPIMAPLPVPQTLGLLQSHPSHPPHHLKYQKHFACTSHVLCGAGQHQTTDNFSSRADDEPSNILNPHLCPDCSESSVQSEAVKTIHPKIGICRHICRSPHCEFAEHHCGHLTAENTTSTHTSPVTSDTIRRGVPSPSPSMSGSSSSTEHLDIFFETGKAYDASDSNLEEWTDGSIADTGGVMPGGEVSNEHIEDSHPDESSMCTSLSSPADSPLIKSSLKKQHISPSNQQKRKPQLQNAMPNTKFQKGNDLGLARFLSIRSIPKSHPPLKIALDSDKAVKKPTQSESSSSKWVSCRSLSPGQLAEQNSAASPVSSNMMSPQAVLGQSGSIKKSFGSKEKNCIPAFRTIADQPSKSTSFGGRNRHLAAPYTTRFSSDSSVSNRNCWNKSTFSMFLNSYNTKFIDTHCHLDLLFRRQPFKGTFSEYHKQHKATFPSNFEGCVTVFCNPKYFSHEGQWRPIVEDTGVWMAAGCHPKSATDFTEWALDSLQHCLKHDKVVALGEIGLDYSKNYKLNSELQKRVFARQIKIALDSQLPLVVHCREAEEDCFNILKQYVPHNYKVHCHCFTSSLTVATCWMSHFTNMYFGLTPLVTYQSATETHEVAEFLPLEKLLLETDAPYFLPGGFNTSTHGLTLSHPGMALTVATRVAELRKMQVEDVLVQVRQNTLAMYGI
ncbi:uncharacterized protein LOC112572020 isoform X4 [Pomacea canaliculata]|uniref:uncharacterized protein LOC112572020 isoform X4 n=1 Tax=Pomacea canaliculata TaxID=400727 RepID=UPI000D732448|nr:uncharacterized protein LOC112572020 isoform X4 [Pomacea canaliculata]XP_025107301.1 uncharacterized protein LOC112572020 isoform X4 [Pomacea canaliculata]